MTNYTSGTVVMPWPKTQPGQINHDEYEVFKAFVAPDGSKWISEGIYEQAKDLEKSEQLVKKLQAQIADLQFPVEGMSGTPHGDSWVVWKTGPHKGDSISFNLGTCEFCGANVIGLYISDDWQCIHVCKDCMAKAFDGALAVMS